MHVQVFSEVAAAMRGDAVPPRAQLQDAIRYLQLHAHGLAAWEGDERTAVLQMRKFVPLYLHGFESAGGLRSDLMCCSDLAAWDLAVDRCQYDPEDIASERSDSLARLKGGKYGATKRVVLPDRWLDADFDCENITDMACEG